MALIYTTTWVHDNCVMQLIAAGADVNKVEKVNILSALVQASTTGHVQIVSELIKSEAFVNHAGSDDCTALMKASIMGNFACVVKLLEAVADVNKTGENGMTALMYAVMNSAAHIQETIDQLNLTCTPTNEDYMKC